MGAYCNDDLTFSPNYTFASSRDNRFRKHVHGNIYLDPIFLKFIDTEEFQRLRDLKQLGVAHMVYPGATMHSRFEHSLGVYWLAGDAVQKLKTQQGSELGIERFDVQTVKLAGRLHDIGHGPFSHLFQWEFLPQVLKGSKWSHERMSVNMIDDIVDEHHVEIDSETIKKVKEMILASSELALPKTAREKHFLYDIVANSARAEGRSENRAEMGYLYFPQNETRVASRLGDFLVRSTDAGKDPAPVLLNCVSLAPKVQLHRCW